MVSQVIFIALICCGEAVLMFGDTIAERYEAFQKNRTHHTFHHHSNKKFA